MSAREEFEEAMRNHMIDRILGDLNDLRFYYGDRAIMIAAYDEYEVMDEPFISDLKRSIEIDARRNNRNHLISLGCIDANLP